MQPRACVASRAAAAAHNQQRFWQYHDTLFGGNLAADEANLQAVASVVGLEQAQWRADRQAVATRAKVDQDVQLGIQLGVAATPTVFIDGRRSPSVNTLAIAFLIQHELQANSALAHD